MLLTVDDLLALCTRHGASPPVARIATACALVESGGDTEATGDQGHSVGLFQMHDQGLGAGMTRAQRADPDTAAAVMVPIFQRNYDAGVARGFTDERLARFVAMETERPAGYPNLDSAAANRYAAQWQTVPEPGESPAAPTYDPDTAPERQLQNWTCSIHTATWVLRSVGVDVEAGAMQDAMVAAHLVSPADGLLDGSGAGLANFLAARSGLEAKRDWFQDVDSDWAWLQQHAGAGPIALGSDSLNHWLAVRKPLDADTLATMNPAPNYHALGDTLTRAQYAQWAPWAGVWLVVPEPVPQPEPEPAPEPSPDPLAACISTVGYLSGDVADALDLGLAHARIATTTEEQAAAYDEIEAAIATLRRGGAPA